MAPSCSLSAAPCRSLRGQRLHGPTVRLKEESPHCVSVHAGNSLQLVASFPFLFQLDTFPRLTLKQPSRERNTNSPSTDEHERVDTLESEQTLWEKGGKKEKKRRRQLPWKLPSCHPLLRNGVADEPNSQGLRALFNPVMPEEPPQPPEYSEQG